MDRIESDDSLAEGVAANVNPRLRPVNRYVIREVKIMIPIIASIPKSPTPEEDKIRVVVRMAWRDRKSPKPKDKDRDGTYLGRGLKLLCTHANPNTAGTTPPPTQPLEATGHG